MLSESKIITFVGATSLGRSREFYEKVLGLELVEEEPTALVFDSNGTMLRISEVTNLTPAPMTVLGWEVTDIQKLVDELVGRGIVMERFEGLEGNDDGIVTFPDGTMVVWFRDPAENVLSLSQFK